MKRTMRTIPIALILVLLIATATLFAVLPLSGDEAYASGSVSLSLSTMQAQGTCPDSYIEYGDWWWEGVTGTNGGIKFTDNQITINYENAAILQSVNRIKVTGSLSSDITVGHAAVLYNNSNWPQSSGTGSTINIDRNFAKDPNANIFTLFFTKDDLTDSTTTVTITSLEITLYYSTTEPVAITKGTGVKSVYLSTTDTATSGSASGTEFESGATVYGFAELAKGYNAGSGWTKVSGTANTEGAKYRVGSVTAGSNNFGTISATKATYNITYNLNGGTHGSTHPNTYQVDTNTFTISNPTKTGYTFKGWSGTGLSGDSNKNVSVAKGSVGDRTYTANWTVNQYNITYKDQGNANFSGSHASGYPTTHTYGTATTLKSASKTGYTFGGWFTNQNCTGSAVTSLGATAYTANITLYAKWTAINYSINYTLNDGTATNPTSYNIETATFTLNNPTRTGYTFTGWTGSNGSTPQTSVSVAKGSTGDKTYTANWELTNYNLTYELNGGEVASANPTTYTYLDDPITLNNPTKTGYTFKGWSGTDLTGDSNTPVTIATNSTGARSYTANWTPNVYNIVVGDQNVNATYDEIFPNVFQSEADIPTMNGYTFFGYYDVENEPGTASPSGTKYTDAYGHGIHVWDKAEDDVQLYAYFTKDMTVTVYGYEHDYDGYAHGITVEVTDPADDYVISYGEEENVYPYTTAAEAEKTNVDTYNIYIWIEKAGYTDYFGGPYTIKINQVDKKALEEVMEDVNDYYDDIETNYPDIAATLEGHKQQISNDYYIEENVTAAQVAAAVEALDGYLSAAKVAVTETKIDAIGSGDYTAEIAADIAAARDYYDNVLNDGERALVDPAKLDALVDAEELYGPVGDVVDEIDALGAITDPQAFKEAVETARANYAALTPAQKDVFPADTLKVLTDSEAIIPVVDEINAIGTPENTAAFSAAVQDARADYDALTGDQKAIFLAAVLAVLTDDEAIIPVMDKIDAIGDVEYTDESKGKIDDANDAYDALTDDQKALVANYGTLEQANDDYDSVQDAVLAINSIGTVYYVDEIKNLIDDARELVDGLSDYQASILPEESLKTLVDDEAAYEAMGKINAIPDVIENTAANLALVDVAKDFFDNLTEDQQDKVRPNFVSKLEDAVAAANAIKAVNAIGDVEYTQEDKDAIDAAKDLLEALTDKQDDFIPDGFADHLADIEAVYDALASIATIGTPENTEDFRDKVEGAREAYDDLTDGQKDLVLPAYVKGIEDAEAVVAAMDEVDAIGTVEYTADTKDLIDAARAEYDGLTADQKGIFPADTLKTLVDAEKAYEAMDKISAIGDVELTDASKELIDEARETYDALTADQKALVDPDKLQTLIDAENAYEAMRKIDAIGELEYTEACKELIDQARAYYDALTDAQKAAVDNYDDLTKAERDYAAVDSSVNSVTDIEGIRYDQMNQELILGAREEYEALTVEQKAFFPEDVYQDLIDKERAIAALEKIAAIGDVAYNEDSEALIQEAREAYDGLTDEQKALIHADDVSTLTVAEQNYGKLDTDARTTYTVLLVLVCILLAAGLALLVFLVYRIMKGKKKNASSVMSVAFFPALLGASHYVDSPFLALYILAALTVLVLVADIILAIKYPKIFKSLKNIFKKGKEEEQPVSEPKAPAVEAPTENIEQNLTEQEDGEEEETIVVTENGTTFRIQFIKSFTAKLIQSGDETKEYYKVLKNEILSYKGIKSRTSWHYDSFNAGRNQLIKISVRGKTLCLYFALAIKDLQGSKYKVEYCESAKYAAVPCMYRIRNDRRCEYAKDLIAMVAEKFGLVKGENPNEQYSFPYESTAALLEKGLIKEVKTKIAQPVADGRTVLHSVDAAEADRDMTDEVAATYIVDDVDGKAHSGKKGIVNIDVLSANFNDGDTVDIEALWAKKLVPASVGRVKLLAKGTLDKSLNVDLQDYSLQAVKMIILVGGTVHRAK